MTTMHTPEPWTVSQRRLPSGDLVITAPDHIIARVTTPANAARIVACVNALAGINPEAVPNAIEALRLACQYVARGVVEHAYDNCVVSGEHALERIDTALAALEA